MLTTRAVNTQGRIGNQLFCIASTIGLALRHGVPYQFPLWNYQQYFANKLPVGNPQLHRTIREKQFAYSEYPELKDANRLNFGLSGYWQSPKYWEGHEAEVREALRFKDDLLFKVVGAFPRREGECCISVRRGDYVNNPNYYALTLDHYYHPAIFRMGTETPYIVFSDDVPWCKETFAGLSNVRFVEGLSDIESLCRMSLCSAFITANSTFSWWGCYLSGSRRVIRPAEYFAGGYEVGKPIDDLYPANWEII